MNKETIAHNTDSGDRTKDVTTEDNQTFQSMFLSQKVLDGLTSCGFRKPSPIQLKAIPVGRCGFDLIVKSKSGTGKTIVFSVIALETVNTEIHDLQVLIIAPTREIAIQIADVLISIGKNIDDLKICSFIGGSPERDDIEKAENCQIAIGAPGRVKSLMKQNILKVDCVKLFVLDEADKLMDNFQDDLNQINYYLPLRKQIIAVSATFPKYLNDFLNDYMQSPTQVTVEFETPLLLGLKQYIKEVKHSFNSVQEMKHKNEELLQILETVSFTQCLIFSNYQTRAETVSLMLNRCGWNSTFISAAQTQVKRLEAIDNLKSLKYRILISTDLTARGIDMVNIDLIINYDIPSDVITYLHRMGRAGRYGSRGLCVTLISGTNDIKKIQKFLGIIGGANLTISKLPDIKGRQIDLWEANSKEFEQLAGIVEEDDENKNLSLTIKNEILNLKSKNNEESEMHSKKTVVGGKNSFDDNIGKNTIDHLNSLHINEKTCKSSESMMESNYMDMQIDDSRVVLESMAKGLINFQSSSESECIEVADSKFLLENVSIFNSLSTKDKGGNIYPVSDRKSTFTPLVEGESDYVKFSGINLNNILTDRISNKYMEGKEKKEMCNMKNVGKEKQNDCENITFLKNKALYEIAEILTDQIEVADCDKEGNLKKYLNPLENQIGFTKQFSQVSKISISEELNSVFQLSNFIQDQELERVDTSCTGLCDSMDVRSDNIFLHAYQFGIEDNYHWKFVIPEIELNDNQEEVQECGDSNYVTSNEEDDDDCSGIQYDESGKRIYAYKDIPNRMVWIPVEESVLVCNDEHPKINIQSGEFTFDENISDHCGLISNKTDEVAILNESEVISNPKFKSTQSDQRIYANSMNIFMPSGELDPYSKRNFCHDHFVACLDQCNDELWQNGLRFNSVENFDNWFYDWQERVQHVSNYIRQNIYVKELSDYQNRKEGI